MFEFKHVSFTYEKTKVLNDISFSIDQGSFAVIVGANGSGKSTILKCLLNLLSVESGEILIQGTPINQFTDWDHIGYVGQNSHQFNASVPVSVEEVVQMGQVKKIATKTVDYWLDYVGMLPFKKSRITDLSGGQQQKVFIARALVANPKALVLDEPTVGLDAKSTHEFYNLLGDLNQKEQKTIVVVSHDVHIMDRHVTEVIEVRDGICFAGSREAYQEHHIEFCEVCGDEV